MKVSNFKNTSTRRYGFVEVVDKNNLPDGRSGILGRRNRGILGEIIDLHRPLIPKYGGIVDSNFIIITPLVEYFYGFSYAKDLMGWNQQIEIGAQKLGLRLAEIIDDEFLVINDGMQYRLIDCEFEHYNFSYLDKEGNRQVNKKRARIDKGSLFFST